MDARLMLGAKCGDLASLDALVRKYRGALIHHIYRIVRDPAVSEELAQEAFLRVHRSRELYEATAKFKTWLYSIATHLALNWLRDHQRERQEERLEMHLENRPYHQAADPGIGIDEWLVLQVKLSEIRQAVHELPDRQRQVLVLHKFEDMECRQIAREMGSSHQAVRSLLCRAYATLRERLAHMHAEC
jgi:RNA polymerase sigma-70 factor (ECF subfamily)